MMKKQTSHILPLALLALAAVSCGGGKTAPDTPVADSLETEEPDTTVYGRCGEGTTMHSLELLTDEGKTMTMLVGLDADSDPVKGGLLAGDRMAVTYTVTDGDTTATRVINLNTLEGKWTSLSRNFEILDGGDVVSSVESEKNPWTAWKIRNGRLLLGRDTFDVLTLGADSLEIESTKGIFVFRRGISPAQGKK